MPTPRIGDFAVNAAASTRAGELVIVVNSFTPTSDGVPRFRCLRIRDGRLFRCPDPRCEPTSGCVICSDTLRADALGRLTPDDVRLLRAAGCLPKTISEADCLKHFGRHYDDGRFLIGACRICGCTGGDTGGVGVP